jgi:hypothetical protein
MVLNMASLNLGVLVTCDDCNTSADSAFARVWRQSPAAHINDRISLGTAIDIWLSADTAGLRPSPNWNDPRRYDETDTVDVIE